ncbi:restriction endonuclease subunit S [Enterococcus cecorum]|uniref:restriction endonuclease subunit S n=1 Tax=Enterococcus cecorum TaxID=44008 RepID=UPI000640CAA9|nr:restriction endonuclease subunit S [Enterococcus cecorum]KLN94313.1 type I restriction endonuclease subunit S [Enterococcus cecorum]KLN94473.1 type I restriction endonuclease subunit S [Enterococcus cecorum]KLO67213.1 type I restriction endonuclease subunit S [Enterococcus cecorum]CAI3290883.1 restriction endonuclease subunit S [Enterococcus cecorum]CAI3308154.1 restriction endonuclease subunit S [Enterococcus cecorum]
MGLTKYKIGDLISVVDERNNIGIRDFYGININKEFMPTAANTQGLDETKYKLVRKNRFVYSGMQTGRDECIRISMYTEDTPILVSPAYTTFEVTALDIVLPLYFFMKFMTKEKDRYGAFCSDGSIRSNLDWDVFCDIELELPSIDIQRKYVNIYNAMLENQKCYERGLDDLKLTCDAYIDELKHKIPCEAIGPYIKEYNRKNDINLTLDFVRGITTSKEFINTKANMTDVSLKNYKIVEPKMIAFISDTSRRADKISLAINRSNNSYLVSSISTIIETNETRILSKYLYIFFCRNEFDRYARFNSWGSARETFTFEEMKEVSIPIPDIKIQKAIVNIFEAYDTRKSINAKLKEQIKDICPILIKGSIEEGRKTKEA